MKEEILQEWPDGHKLSKDSHQWIVKHPAKCKNSRTGNLTQDYMKFTYFGDHPAPKEMPQSLRAELDKCQLKISAARSDA